MRGKRKAHALLYRILSQLLQERRARLGLRQRDLADATGVTLRQVKRWERGLSKPGSQAYTIVMDTLQFSTRDLIRVRRAAAGMPEVPDRSREFSDLTL